MRRSVLIALPLVWVGACSADSNPADTGFASQDSGIIDSGVNVRDTETTETTVPDTSITETSTVDSGVPDTTPVDTSTEVDPTTDTTPDVGVDTTLDVEPDVSFGPSYGTVAAVEVRIPADSSQNSGAIVAHFAATAWPTAPSPTQTLGACVIAPVDVDGEYTSPSGPSYDAGMISVLAMNSYDFMPIPTSGGVTYRTETVEEIFSGGAVIQMSGTGGADVPAFSGNVVAPSDPRITSPSGSDWGSASAPLFVSWSGTPSNTGEVVISLVAIAVDFGGATVLPGNGITCTVPDTGSYTIPSEVMAYYSPGSGFANSALTVVRASETVLTQGSATIVLNATAMQTAVGDL